MEKVKLSTQKTSGIGKKFRTLLNEQGNEVVCPVTPPFLNPNDFGKIEFLRLPCNSNCLCFDIMDEGKFFGCRFLKVKYEIQKS
jgi:hypothetical protein